MKNTVNSTPKDSLISNGFWGIFHELDQAPQVRLDPFRSMVDERGTKIGHYSYISTLRADRPDEYLSTSSKSQFSHLQEGEDSFCRLIAGKLPSIVISRDLELTNNPLSTYPAFEDLRDSKVFSSINLFTPMARILPQNPTHSQKNSLGIPLLHSFTKHYQSIEEIPIDEVILFLKNIILTVEASRSSLSAGKNKAFTVFHFYNIGPNAGSSIPHLHGQTFLYTERGYGWKNQSFFLAYEKNKQLAGKRSYCFGCKAITVIEQDLLGQQLNIKERTIWEDDYWLAFTAYAPERDGHIRILPKRHVSSIWELTSIEITSLAQGLKSVNRILSQFVLKFGGKLNILTDRNILFRQKHFGYTPSIHMFIDIIPVQRVGGVEILDDHRISHIFPEEAAKRMGLLNS